jgi:uncharacterized protein (TIGR03435 family)
MIFELLSFLANHIWQSTGFAICAGLLTLALRNCGAAVRFNVWLAASLKFLVPLSLLFALRSVPAPPAEIEKPVAAVIQTAAQPFQVLPPEPFVHIPPQPNPWPRILLAIWILGSCVVAVRWLLTWMRARRLLRAAVPMAIDAPIPVLTSATFYEPAVFGIFRPVLLLPDGIRERLTPEQFRAILAHELCHVRRRDNLKAALHMVVESIFWFHPLVWWMRSRLIEERERACDEEVVRLGSDPGVYARSILLICEAYVESLSACASGVTGADLKLRIRTIMSNRVLPKLSLARKLTLAAAGLAAVVVPIAIGQQTPAPRPEFEVATIKPNTKGGPGIMTRRPVPGRWESENTPLSFLILHAWNARRFQLVGGPEWTRSERFDIQASVPLPATGQQVQLMLQRLLEDRFQLKIERAQREQPVYILQPARQGLKIRPIAPGSCIMIGPDGQFPEQEEGKPVPPQCGGTGYGPSQITGNGITMAEFARLLEEVMQRPVIDRTGLTDLYNIKIKWMADESTPGPMGGPPTAKDTEPGPSIFTVLQEELGLRLEASRAPAEVLVIQSAERPSEN